MMSIIVGTLMVLLGVWCVKHAIKKYNIAVKEKERAFTYDFVQVFSSGVFIIMLSWMTFTNQLPWHFFIPNFILDWFE
jgi:putative Mn2+ efflux pump MntP